jgi:hypothetical protein
MTKPKPKAAASTPTPAKTPAPAAPELQVPQEAEPQTSQMPAEATECRYIAYCTEDGVCPYGMRELMKKVRLQAIKDTLELIKMEKKELSSIQLKEEQ